MTRTNGFAVAALLTTSACQGYDADPVKPEAVEVQDNTQTIIGHPLAPNIMLLVDRSGSMTDGADGMTPGACANASGDYSGMRSQNCKWNNLLDTLIGPNNDGGFLSQLDQAFATNAAAGDPLPLGLTELPGPSTANPDSIAYSCAASSMSVLEQILPTNESPITSALLAIQPGGGTPTAASVQVIGGSFPTTSGTATRADYVIIMTDGAPNCDSSFPSPSATNCSGDRCTLGEEPPPANCPSAEFGEAGCECSPNGTVIPEGCLDESATVANIAAAFNQTPQIKTFVIGFGAAAVGGSSTETLEEMGQAGATGSSTGYSASSFYAAASLADLADALTAILGKITPTKCVYVLSGAPPTQQLIEIIITPDMGTPDTLTDSQFTYDTSAQTVTITDMNVCNTILESTPNNPVQVEIKYLQSE